MSILPVRYETKEQQIRFTKSSIVATTEALPKAKQHSLASLRFLDKLSSPPIGYVLACNLRRKAPPFVFSLGVRTSMRPEDVLKLLESVGAIRQGHFELSSGLHSASYVQCALVLQHPRYAEQLGRALAAAFNDLRVSCVASPALGGIILGHEVARAIGVRAVFAERDASAQMALRRGFRLEPHEEVLVVEDVWTTGASTVETIQVIEQAGGCVVGAGALIDRAPRRPGKVKFSVRAKALLELEIQDYQPSECSLCRAGSKPERPGSRVVPTAF